MMRLVPLALLLAACTPAARPALAQGGVTATSGSPPAIARIPADRATGWRKGKV